MTDYKQLCAELLRAMDEIEECEAVDWSLVKTKPLKMANQSMAEARAALSDKELLEKGPSLEEVEELCEEHCFNVEGYESLECLQGLINDALVRWGTPNLTETRRSLTDAWAAHQPAIEAAAKAGMTEHTTPPCCEAWESWADSANWFVDTESTYRMPHLKGTHHRFNFCPSCGSERRNAIVVAAELEDN